MGRGLVVVMSLLIRSDISYEADIYTRGGTKINATYSFLRNYNYTRNEIYVYRGHILFKVVIIFLPSLFHY